MELSPFSGLVFDLVGWAKALFAPCPPSWAGYCDRRWARGACHRARIRATRWLSPPYTSSFLAGRVARLGLGVHRIEAGQCRAIVHLVDDPGFHPLLLRPFGQHMVEQRLRDQHRAVLVGDDDVVGKHRYPAASDRLAP